ncbi:MAG: zinc ribbon domain-containing protein [Lachnospiraceae bacterium]|nr:zinc ribbon domain-containing protein [Lachnospiraceae bacterium]
MEKICKKCGAEIQEDSVFCEMCGARIKEEVVSEKEPTSEGKDTPEENGEEIYLFHPIKMARRLAAKYTIEEQKKRKKFLRFFIVLFELVLLCGNMVACGDTVYTGRELIRQTLKVDFSGWNQWGKAVVPVLFLIYGYVLIRTFMVKEREFQKHIRTVWNANLLLFITVVFYTVTDYFELKSGAFVCLAIGIVVNGLMIYGTAYEIQNGLEPAPGRIHAWFVPKEVILSLALLEITLCVIMHMKCSDEDLQKLFWVAVAVKIFSAGISCLKREKSYQVMKLQSCVDLLCCVVLFLYCKTYIHSDKYLLDSGLMLAMGVISPFGFNYLLQRQGREGKIRNIHKKMLRLTILLAAVVSIVIFKTSYDQLAREEMVKDFYSYNFAGIWDLEGINGNLVIYSEGTRYIERYFRCHIDGDTLTGSLYRSSETLYSSDNDFELEIKEEIDWNTYLVDIDYISRYGERLRCEDVTMTKTDPEEVSSYIFRSISDQAKKDIREVYVPLKITFLYDEGEMSYESLGRSGTDNLNKVLNYNDGMIKGYSKMQFTQNSALLYHAPIYYVYYEIDPAREFNCVNEYSKTEYSY